MSCKLSLKGLSAAVAIAAATISAAANAATIRVDQVVTNAYAADFTPLPAVPDLNAYVGPPVVLEIEYHVNTSNILAGERGFGNVGFSILQGPGVAEAGAGGWNANTATFDSNGPGPGGGGTALYSTNADAGPSNSDLLGIFATIAGGISNPNLTFDQRMKIGQPGGPSLLGTVFLLWDGTTPSSIAVGGTQASAYTLSGSFVPGVPGESTPLLLTPGIIPEPGSLALAGLAGLGLLFNRRRSA